MRKRKRTEIKITNLFENHSSLLIVDVKEEKVVGSFYFVRLLLNTSDVNVVQNHMNYFVEIKVNFSKCLILKDVAIII